MDITTVVIIIAFLILMFIAIVAYFAFFYGKLKKVDTEIQNLIRYLNSLKKQAADDVNFYVQNFEDIDKKFNTYGTVRQIWNDFRKSLIHHKDTDSEQMYSVSDASEYFSFQNFTQKMNLTFWQGYGGTFTGLGILGTFFGLTVGLSGLDMTSSDIEVLKAGIAELLSGVQFAFITSLIGIILAIFYGPFHNGRINAFRKNVQSLSDLVEEMFPRHTSEYWLHEGYVQTTEQTTAIKNIATDVSQAIFDAFDQRFDDGISRLCDQIEEKITPLFESVCDSISKLGNNGAHAINETISKIAGSQMQDFAESLNTFTGNIQKNIAESRQTADEMNKVILETLSEMQSTLKTGAEDAANQMRNSTMGLQTTLAKHEETLQQNYDRAETLIQRTEKFLSVVESASESLERATAPLQESINSLKDCLEKNVPIMNQLTTENQKSEQNIRILIAGLQRYEKNIETAWTNYENNFNRVGGELEKATNIITERLGNYNDTMNNTMIKNLQEFDKSISKAVGLLESSVEELQETLDDIFKKE